MIKDSPEYIEKYGRTNDILLGVIMFWMLTSMRPKAYSLTYFNEKMYRFLNYYSTEKQMDIYKNKMNISVMDANNNVESIEKVIDIIFEIFGTEKLDYQLHMYGASKGGSGDYWLETKEEMMNNIVDVFPIIASSNGVSIVTAERLKFLTVTDWKRLETYCTRIISLNKILS